MMIAALLCALPGVALAGTGLLPSGGSLGACEEVSSPNGAYVLRMQCDGNLVLVAPGNVSIWASDTPGTTNPRAFVQGDGNLVVVGSSGARWATGTYQNDGAVLRVQDDGNVVLYRPDGRAVWSTHTVGGRLNVNRDDINDVKGWAKDRLGWFGWREPTDAQWRCLDALWTRESGWRWNATNRSSGAYGIPQALPGTKMQSHGADWRESPATQIRWGLDYVRGRYGNPCVARDHQNRHGWY
jgi:hypothetical protein